MLKDLLIYTLLFISLVIISCKGQNRSAPIKETIKKSPSVESKKNLPKEILDYDPYFVESEPIESAFGPKSIVRNMIQDKKGNIWIASWEGIIRYDGTTFTNFTNKDSLRRYHVFCALEDRKGNLWFGTIGGGIYVYDGASFINYTTKEGLVYDGIGCISEDKSGKIWIGTQEGLSRYDGLAKDIKSITFKNFTTKDGLSDNDINSIIEDKNGQYWIGTRGAACVYDGKTFSKFFNTAEVIKTAGRPFVNVRSIIEDKSGNIWLGGNDGLWRYDGKAFTNFNKNFVGYIYEDKAGNIWTNSASASPQIWILSRYDKRPLAYEQPTATIIKEEMDMFFGIMEDKSGNIWWGSLNGIHRFDGTTFTDFQQ